MFKSVDRIFSDGVAAYRAGRARVQNPYSIFRPSHWTWLAGWFSARCEGLEMKAKGLEIKIDQMIKQRDTLEKSIRDLSATSTILQRQVSRESARLAPPDKVYGPKTPHTTGQLRSLRTSTNTGYSGTPTHYHQDSSDTGVIDDLVSLAMQAAVFNSTASLPSEPCFPVESSPPRPVDDYCPPSTPSTPSYEPSTSCSYSSSESDSSSSSSWSDSSSSSDSGGGSCGGGD